MKKDMINGASTPDETPSATTREIIEHSPALHYLEANNYFLLREEKLYSQKGELVAKGMTYRNEALGLEVALSWPVKTAQVFLVVNGGSQQIVAPMQCLYSQPHILQDFLIDASALRSGRPNVNTASM